MMRIASIFIAVLLLIPVLPLSSASSITKSDYESENSGLMDSPWPMLRHDVHHTGRSPYGKDGCTALLKWKVKIGGGFLAHPVIDKNGTIYTGSYCSGLYAIYPNGTIKWTLDIDVWGIAIARDGTIYVGGWERYLYAISPDGTIKWKCKINGGACGYPLIGEDGTIYVGSSHPLTANGKFYAIYPNGTIKWRVDLDGCSSAVLNNNTIYTDCFRDGYLYAIYANNGTIKWKKWEGSFGTASYGPSVDERGIVYYASQNGYLYAFYPNGTLKWKYNIGGSYTPPAISKDGTLYVASGSNVYAFNSNGSLLWKRKTYSARSLIIDKNGVIYGLGDYHVYALNPNGTLRWVWKTNEYLMGGPSIGEDGTIYFVGESNLYAIEPRDAADLRITAFYCGLTVGCVKIKVKNVGKYPAYNVTCTARIYMINLLMDGRDRYEKYTTVVPDIYPGQEVEVRIGDIFLFDPLFFFWDCTLEIIRVEADNANHDIFLEGGKIKQLIIIGPFVLSGGFNPNNWRWIPAEEI